jgi:uncharacterized tellurite resistance protein B-like protein
MIRLSLLSEGPKVAINGFLHRVVSSDVILISDERAALRILNSLYIISHSLS